MRSKEGCRLGGEYQTELNIDFLVAGCNTRCKRGYVCGGPGPRMPVATALLCLENGCFGGSPAFCGIVYLGSCAYEPSDLVKILAAAAQTKHISYYHHGMTTGLGLMHRQNRDDTDWTQKK